MDVWSSIYSGILKNPTACSYVLGPRLGTCSKSSRDLKPPILFLYLTKFSAVFLVKPDTYVKSDLLAVFAFTPTWFTT